MSWFSKLFKQLDPREIAEEAAKAIVRGTLAEIQAKAVALEAESVVQIMDAALDACPDEYDDEMEALLRPQLQPLLHQYLQSGIHSIVGKVWAEVERINPSDTPDPSPA